MLRAAVYHKPYGNYVYPVDKDQLFLRLRAKKGD